MFEIKGKNTRLIYLPDGFSEPKVFCSFFFLGGRGGGGRELLEEMIPCAEYFNSFMTKVTII